ncbi:phytanoyl-CoA dioxygenase domain-containing protein 1 homolog [Phlebotomus argentipes]|uniref:phytanoyl-CoA dioxygenase domain-containing protein 1 homolog n=1 Tax=Phlebotomus argentipes TaxID=94469 RepID=UPI002892A26A|nr:phytanoyl-CoA dioxygenase domain-containing protein 1 homolog [Phlebotomus argentipes]
MRNSLLEELNENGYVVLEGFLLPEEVEEVLTAGQELCLEAPKESRTIFSTVNCDTNQNKERYFIESADKVRYFFEEGALDEKGDLVVKPENALNKVGHSLHTDHDTFKKFTFSHRVREACWQLGFKRPAVPQSMYIYKNPGIGGEVIAHQDGTFLHTEPASTVGFWIALHDASTQNGCLQFIKGSHKSGVHRRYVRNQDQSSNELLVYDRPAPIYPASNFTSVPVEAGTCVLIHSQVVHRSDQNKSNKARHAYTFHVIETDGVKYSEDNWLQSSPDSSFPILYE